MSNDDAVHMRHALRLARRGLGNVAPNPAVGCVIVADDVVVGRGWTQRGGRPHAETMALMQAGARARGATAYVTLEPCAHHGQTPPCARALIDAGLARVAIAALDPDPRVCGRGRIMLEKAGIAVSTGLCEEEARFLNAGFLLRIEAGRPLVTLKLATSLDGRIATHNGHSKWITGERTRAYVHMLRATHDAILTGIGTVLADDPDLGCRLAGLEDRTPLRVVLDSHLRLPLTSRLVRTARERPLLVFCRDDAEKLRRKALEDCGVEVRPLPPGEGGYVPVAGVLKVLAEKGMTRLLVEAGGHVAASFLRARLVDRLEWHRAALIIGGDGRSAVEAYGIDALDQAARLSPLRVRRIGEDLVESYALKA